MKIHPSTNSEYAWVEFDANDRAEIERISKEIAANGRASTRYVHDVLDQHRENTKIVVHQRGVRVPCEKCYGLGTRAYASTATWRGGLGGAAVTRDVCDECWGSGDAHSPWPSWRKAEALRAAVDDLLSMWMRYPDTSQPGLGFDPYKVSIVVDLLR